MAMLTVQNLIDEGWYWCELTVSWRHDEHDHVYWVIGNSVQRKDL